MTLQGLNGKQYQLESKPLGSGGEGDIYAISGNAKQVVKIYKKSSTSQVLEEKLKLMVQRPPSSSVLNQVAWPLDVVYDSSGAFCGFVMPKLDITHELNEVYVYPPRTGITYKQKLILAQNICVVIHEVHKAGYVFGDFNPRNIGVNLNTGAVAFLDTDSYHIVIDKASNRAYRCNVCAPGYAAPELLKKCTDHISAHPEDKKQAYAKTPLDTFTKETDNFALAIHMFRLLMNGFTPFNGIPETQSASVGSPGQGDAAVRRDSYCFKPGNKPQAAAVPELDSLPKTIQDYFTRAFIDGKKDPTRRPSALEWHKALESFERELVTCNVNPAHMYQKRLKSCPWCEADSRYSAMMNPQPQLIQKAFTAPVVTTPIAPSSNSSQMGGQSTPPSSGAVVNQGSPMGTLSNLSVSGPSWKNTTNSKGKQYQTGIRDTIGKILFIGSSAVLIWMIYWAFILLTPEDIEPFFGDWVFAKGFYATGAWIAFMVAYTLNLEKGFRFGDLGYGLIIPILIVNAILITILYVSHTKDYGGIIAFPMFFCGIYMVGGILCFIIYKIDGWIFKYKTTF